RRAQGRPRGLRRPQRRPRQGRPGRHLWPGDPRGLLGGGTAMNPASRLLASRLLGAALMALALANCSKPAPPPQGSTTISFSVLSAEDAQSMAKSWQPLFDDMQKATGLTIKPYYATNYASLVEAMRFNQTQAGWFSALPALEATRRANAEVLGRILTNGSSGAYQSLLITRKGSNITLDDVLKCGKKLNFGIGDPKSTSGTLAPMAYVFVPHSIEPADCFKTVKSASHQANFFGVANGLLDVATKVQVIGSSPDLPESSILVRKDVDPAIKEKIRQFFLTYGQAPGAEG